MFVAARALAYGSIFVAVLLVVLPARVLSWAGIAAPATIGIAQVAGMMEIVLGAALALWCILTFALVGRGTPAPFDPPRRLVARGPYRFVRNPMYAGAVIALAGAALYFGSWALLAYGAAFALASHLLVVTYEEPRLRRTFGEDYERYLASVGRWWPRG
jgi:protein-S-isoprenylcysteine O-methyltransferase Ste14